MRSSQRIALPLGAACAVLLRPPCPAAGAFVDATSASGLYGGTPTWGAQAVDIDGDGDIDLLNGHHFYGTIVFTNDGSGTFSCWGIPQFAPGSADRHGFLWADLDGDEILDVVCSHGGAGGFGCPDAGNELWKGEGGGILVSVPGAGGMADSVGRGRSFSAADVDGDGDLDLFHAKAPLNASPNSLYRNDGALNFVDIAPSVGLDENLGTVGGLFGDYDDDGDPDLLVGGDEFSRPTTLWRNDGGVFSEVTGEAFGSLPIIAFADWGDYDNDGDLDLAACEGVEGIYDVWGLEGTEYWLFAHHRLGDDGVDAFEFETPGEDPTALFRWRGSLMNELIFLGPNGEHPAALQGTVTLTDDYVGAPAFEPGVDVGLFCWRESPGGTWEVRVSAPPGTYGNFSARILTSAGVQNPAAWSLEQSTLSSGLAHVYRNDGGFFTDVTGVLGIVPSVNPRAVQWVDFDSDGDLDLHQMNRGTVETGNEPDILWRNDGASFQALEGSAWVPGLTDHFTDGGVWADWDGDGDLDLVVQEGGAPLFFTSSTPALLYRNDGASGHWLRVTLGRTASGGTPVGARVTAHAGALAVHRRVRADSWEGFQRPFALHFGLGSAVTVDSLVVEWPGGSRQVLGPIASDRMLRFSEGENPSASPALLPPGQAPAQVGILHPQPARGRQSLPLHLSSPARVVISVHDVAGRRVRSLPEQHLPAGWATISWDGKDDAGRPVPAGVYFLRARGDVYFQRKAVRVR